MLVIRVGHLSAFLTPPVLGLFVQLSFRLGSRGASRSTPMGIPMFKPWPSLLNSMLRFLASFIHLQINGYGQEISGSGLTVDSQGNALTAALGPSDATGTSDALFLHPPTSYSPRIMKVDSGGSVIYKSYLPSTGFVASPGPNGDIYIAGNVIARDANTVPITPSSFPSNFSQSGAYVIRIHSSSRCDINLPQPQSINIPNAATSPTSRS